MVRDRRGYTECMSEMMLVGSLLVAVAAVLVLAVLGARWRKEAAALAVERDARQAHAAEAAQLRGRLEAVERELAGSQSARATLEAQLAQAREAQVQASANVEHLKAAQAQMQRFVDEAQGKLTDAFALKAAEVLEQKGKQFAEGVHQANERGRTDLDALLKPFADNLGKFQVQVAGLYATEAKERSELTGAVKQLRTLNEDMASKAAELARALRGNAKVRGDWGELMLESVLRGSGLEEGVHYERQQSSTDEDGRRLRPDVVVNLPGERQVVVDSKVNLVAWQDAMNAVDDPELHSLSLQRHSDGLRRHVKDLADRDYPRALGERSLEVTIAFVPIEGALSAALGADPSLQNYAFERGVVFASPNTLMAMLRVVDRLWVRDTMQKRALEIGEAGGKVLDALQGFLADFDMIEKKLGDAGNAFRSARNRLAESPQSAISRAQRLVELGVKGKKTLHASTKVEAMLPAPAGANPDTGGDDADDEA
jgi:DNA recombination protein RmuC